MKAMGEIDSDDEVTQMEEFRYLLPPGIHMGINPRSRHSWFLRCYVDRRLRQVTFNYDLAEDDEQIKARIAVALAELHKRAGSLEA